MKDIPPELSQRVIDAFSGFCGSIVYALRFPTASAIQTVIVVVIGTVSADFFTDDIVRLTSLSRGASGFLAGFAAYSISAYLIEIIVSYLKLLITRRGK